MPTVTLDGSWDSGYVSSGVTSKSVTRNSAVTAGDLLIVCVLGNQDNNVSGVTDGQFGALTTAGNSGVWDSTTGATWMQCWWAVATASYAGSSSNQITANFSSSTGYAEVIAAQFTASSGYVFAPTASVLIASAHDQQAAPGTGVGAILSGATTFSSVPSLAFAMSVDVSGSGGQTVANGWTSTFTGNSGNWVPAWSVIMATGGEEATWTAASGGGSDDYMGMILGFGITTSSSGVTVTSVNGGGAIAEGSSGVPFVGTGFASGMTASVVQSQAGVVGATVAQVSVTYVSTTSGTFGLLMEPASGVELAFSDSVYAHDLQVTVGTASGEGAIAGGLTPPAGLIFATLTSVNATSSYRITALPDLAVYDQLEAAGNSAGSAAAPSGLELNSDGTFQFLSGTTPQNFWVRAYDGSAFVWGPWAEQSIATLTVPNVVGLTTSEAETTLTTDGFDFYTTSAQYSSVQPVGYVIATSPAGGTSADPAQNVVIYVSIGVAPTPPAPTPVTTTGLATPQPTLSATIPSYLYRQYQNDDNLLAFVAAYNAATQVYVDFFNQLGLPFYPGLSGDLLDWVATGLYGLERTNLTQTASPAVGPLDTAELDTITLNSFTAPSVTYYTISDDVFKRILTWNFYKGDGKRFTMKWLKRRIMRFLVGTNGLDPNPLSASFVIGPENTQALSVTVASDVLTVNINGSYISSLVQLQPNILSIFSAAFTGGVLDLPVQYTYACNIVTSLTAMVSPTSESVTGTATTLTTGVASVSALGGDGAYTYAWTWVSGGTGITINSASSADTSFTATGMTRGTTLAGTAKCTVTDSASHTAYVTVPVSIQNVSVPAVSISPASLSTTIASASYTSGTFTANISGGGSPYTEAWSWQSGGAGIGINSPSADATTLSIASIGAGSTDSGTLLVTVTDAYGQTATSTASVSVTRATAPSATVSPTSLTVSSSTVPMTTSSAAVSVSGGQSPYTYSWSFTWESHTDSASVAINSPTAASTTFTASGMSAGNTDTGTGTCTVTDALGQHASTSVSVSFTYLPPLEHVYTSGSGTETVPAGYSTLVIETWGAGAGGEAGTAAAEGNGGAAGGYVRSQYAVTGGQTVDYSVGVGGTAGIVGGAAPTAGTASSVSSGTLSITTMTAGGGATGGSSGGTAIGGNQANDTGGTTADITGGKTTNGVYANNPATSGNGANGGLSGADTGGAPRNGGAGQNGAVAFHYT